MTVRRYNNWSDILTLLRSPEYSSVHKIYHSELGWAYVTGIVSDGKMTRIRIDDTWDYASVSDLLGFIKRQTAIPHRFLIK